MQAFSIKILSGLVILFAIAMHANSHAQSITVGGTNWTASTTAITEAGNNYSTTSSTSATNQILLSTSVPGWYNQGIVSVQYIADPLWHDDLIISVRRTGDGSHSCWLCTLSGGTSFVPVPKVASTEFYTINSVWAAANHNNTPVQIQVSGISVTTPAADYKAKIVFTIMAN